MLEETHVLRLNQAQFDLVEEAADIMALGHIYVNSFEEAVQYLAKWYIENEGPGFESQWCDGFSPLQLNSPT